MSIYKIWHTFRRINGHARNTSENYRWQKNHCGCCGEQLYSFYHYCKAQSRKCYSCGQYGHYAGLCKRTHSNMNVQVPQQNKNTEKQSELCQERNYIASLMPFCSVETTELQQASFNSCFLRKKLTKLCELESKNVEISNQLKKIQEENQQLQATVSKLQLKLEQSAKPKDEKWKHQQKLSELTAVVKLFKNALKAAKAQIGMINTDVMRSRIWDKYQNDMAMIVHFASNPVDCPACGSEMAHLGDLYCSAAPIECGLCNMSGHYSPFCPKVTGELT